MVHYLTNTELNTEYRTLQCSECGHSGYDTVQLCRWTSYQRNTMSPHSRQLGEGEKKTEGDSMFLWNVTSICMTLWSRIPWDCNLNTMPKNITISIITLFPLHKMEAEWKLHYFKNSSLCKSSGFQIKRF